MTEMKLTVGGSARNDAAAFVAAWHRIESGDLAVERSVAFQSWDALASVMTTERLRLLRHVRAQPEASIQALATALGRQYRRVHEDVTILVRAGLLRRDGGAIRATVQRIAAVIELA